MATYYTLLTTIGQAKIANAIALGQNVSWTDMAVGDGNGNPTTPNENQTALVREVYRASINQLDVDPDNPNYMVAEMIVPTNVGGWAVNEVGIFDAEGDMVAVANFPATYKPQLEEGSGRDLVVRIIVQVSNASVVNLKVDPAVVLASQKWVAEQYVKKITVAGGTTGQVLSKKTNANEDFEWVDPTAAVNVIVDAIPERQTLADGQTIVNLAVLTSNALAVYVEGARLIETIDFTVTGPTQITLAQSYPAGSRIHMYQNDPTSMIADASETERGFIRLATVAEATEGTEDGPAMTPATTAGLFPFRGIQVYDEPGTYTWTVPEGVTKAWVIVTGGGGQSGVSNSGSARGGGGGAGGTAMKMVDLTGITSVSVTVGSGGATDKSSSFGPYCSAAGGGGGNDYTGGNAPGGYPGTAVGGDINLTGGFGSDGPMQAGVGTGGSGDGGASFWGGGSRSAGGGSAAIPTSTPGTGCGGSGNVTRINGAPGIVTIQW